MFSRLVFRRAPALVLLLLTGWLAASPAVGADAAPDLNAVLQSASEAFRAGRADESLRLLDKAITAHPADPRPRLLRARAYDTLGRYDEAVADCDVGLAQKSDLTPSLWQERGELNFKRARFTESVADFDRYLALEPNRRPEHWQRGLSLYYAGRFKDGQAQFELHQTVNSQDVENAVWHFLCVARTSGVTNARASLIKITGDTRVPMREVHNLFAGTGTAEQVLASAAAARPGQRRSSMNLLYAHLYLGLYYEALGDTALAKKHLYEAADRYAGADYMSVTAKVHARLYREGRLPVRPAK